MNRLHDILRAIVLAATAGFLVSSTAVVFYIRERLPYAFENANRITRESAQTIANLRAVTKAAEDASKEQQQYWKVNSQKVSVVLDQTQQTIAQVSVSVANMSTAASQTMGDAAVDMERVSDDVHETVIALRPGIENLNEAAAAAVKVIGDPNIPRTLEATKEIAENTAETTENLNLTAADLKAIADYEKAYWTKPTALWKSLFGFVIQRGSEARVLFNGR